MPADTDVVANGYVVDVLPGGYFSVNVKTKINERVVRCHLGGKLKINSIHIVKGDYVEIAMSEYDLSKGRITRRM
jgi:translation initiation factor IF-1